MSGYSLIRRLSEDVAVLAVLLHVGGVDLADLALAVDVVLIDVPGRAAAEPAGRAVLASAAAVERIADDLFPLFFCGVLDQNGSHRYRSPGEPQPPRLLCSNAVTRIILAR